MIKTREQIIANDAMEVSALVVLTDSEFKILDSKDDNIRKRVDAIADDMAVRWAVEESGNQHIGSISRTFGPVVGHNERHEMELIAGKFMEAIRDINLPAIDEPKGPHEDAVQVDESERQERVDFIKLLLHDMNKPKDDEEHIVGAKIMCVGPAYIPFLVPWGKLSHDLFKEMCELYLEANHETEK